MDLREYVRIVSKQWWLILVVGVLGVITAIGVVVTTPKVYTAGAQIFVATASASDVSQLAQGNTFTQARVQSYTSIADSPAVTEPVVRQLDLAMTPDQLASRISASAPVTKVLININVHDGSAQRAATICNAVATQFSQVVSKLEATSSRISSPVKLTVTHPATPPGVPSSPRVKVDLALGLLLGLLVGLGLAVLRTILNNSVDSPEVLAETSGAPVLGAVPFDRRVSVHPVSFRADPHGPRAESFRQLRTNLQFIDVDHRPRVIAVTSALPGEGKSATALNLAAALAEAGFSVCLIEADFRRPTLAKTLGLVSDIGFTSVLIGKVAVEDVMQNFGHNLSVLTSGPVPPNPSEILVSQQARSVIRHSVDHVDYAIIDTAPLLPVADGAEVAAMADATLLVVRAGKTTRDQLTRAVQALAKVDVRPVGAILNMAKSRGADSYLYSYQYSYRPERKSRHANGKSAADGTLDLESADVDLNSADKGA